MKISVAMATYNGAKFLDAQLNSLAEQTLSPHELIVTDDGSSDGTPELVEAFAARACFDVRLYRNAETLGPGHNFARAIGYASGDVIFLCDQDDVWDPDKLERMVAELEARPEIACLLCDARLADTGLRTDGRTKRGVMQEEGIADRHFVQGCCAAFRRPLADLALPMPAEEASHDNWIVGLSDALELTLRMDAVLQHYRIHGENVSSFFVNQSMPETAAERMRRNLGDLSRRLRGGSGLVREHARLKLIHDRIEARPAEVGALMDEGRARAILASLAAHEAKLGASISLRAAPRHKRPAMMWAAVRTGAYAPGPMTALKDLLSP